MIRSKALRAVPAAVGALLTLVLSAAACSGGDSPQGGKTSQGGQLGLPGDGGAELTTAVADMQAAYTEAAGRKLPDFLDLGGGAIGGLTLGRPLAQTAVNMASATAAAA